MDERDYKAINKELRESEEQNDVAFFRLFFVVEEIEDGVWEQLTIGLKTYKEAKEYKDKWDGKHPNAFIVASIY